MIAYFALFMQRKPQNPKLQTKKMKAFEEDTFKEEDYPTDTCIKHSTMEPKDYASVEKSMQDAFESGDYRSVLRCWNTMKKFETMPNVALPQVVESMQRFKKDTAFVVRELKFFIKKFETECDMSCINDILESLAKRLDSELIEQIIEMLPSVGLQKDERSYEVLLNMYFTMRSFQDVKALVADMKQKKIAFSIRSSMVVIKTALKLNNLDEAIQHFRELKTVWNGAGTSSTSMAPSHVVSQLVELACREHKLSE